MRSNYVEVSCCKLPHGLEQWTLPDIIVIRYGLKMKM